jgi:hypothetical protein
LQIFKERSLDEAIQMLDQELKDVALRLFTAANSKKKSKSAKNAKSKKKSRDKDKANEKGKDKEKVKNKDKEKEKESEGIVEARDDASFDAEKEAEAIKRRALELMKMMRRHYKQLLQRKEEFEKEVEEGLAGLELERKKLEAEKEAMKVVKVEQTGKITLNIGGHKYDTSIPTLTKVTCYYITIEL